MTLQRLEGAGHAWRTVERAKKKLGIRSHRYVGVENAPAQVDENCFGGSFRPGQDKSIAYTKFPHVQHWY